MSPSRYARLLVIDDQPEIHHEFRRLLCGEEPAISPTTPGDAPGEPAPPQGPRCEFDLNSAFQGEEGCRMIEQAVQEGRPYAVAVVDVHMPPGWDGITTTQRIWEIDPQVMIVLCSGRVERDWKPWVEKLGRSDRFVILKKPFDGVEAKQLVMALGDRWSMARTDVLTGALNRRSMQEQLDREWARSVRHQTPLSCVMLDLDFFKKINDVEGHQAGDAVLKEATQILQNRCRNCDYLFRYGGEEFCAVLPETTEAQAAIWAGRARESLEAMRIPWSAQELRVTASFGVAERLADVRTADELVDRADQMVRAAKQAGRNRVVRYTAINPTLGEGCARVQRSADSFEGVPVSRVMTEQLAVLRREVPVGDAARFFLECRLDSVPVVDERGRLLGIVSERDILCVIRSPESRAWPVERIMQSDVVSYEADTPATMVFEFLSRVTMRRVIILRDQRPVGIVTQTSLLRWFSGESGELSGETLPATPATRRCATRPLAQAAHSLVERARQLAGELDDADARGRFSDAAKSALIGNVSAMQELLGDLLTLSSSDRPAENAVSAVGLMEGLAASQSAPC